MTSNLEKYKQEIDDLIKRGEKLLAILKSNKDLLHFRNEYEVWYSESLVLIKVVLPDRIEDFKKYYDSKSKNNKCLKDYIIYTPPRSEGVKLDFDYIPAKEVDYARSLFINQLSIVKGAKRTFESSLFNIRQLTQADLFDSELDVARELNKKGFMRGGGAVAGVVLESHLSQVCRNHKINIRKKNPTINDFNSLLKDNAIIEIKDWRFIQHLADLRNLCDHKKKNDPTQDDIDELIRGVEKIIKTIF